LANSALAFVCDQSCILNQFRSENLAGAYSCSALIAGVDDGNQDESNASAHRAEEGLPQEISSAV
jgi:hypothetical protein